MSRIMTLPKLPTLVALWSAFQAAFLAHALSGSLPSPTAELMSTSWKSMYVAFLAFHIIAVPFSVLVLWLESRFHVWDRIGRIHRKQGADGSVGQTGRQSGFLARPPFPAKEATGYFPG